MSEPPLASDPNLSAWVAANAGAGKTYTLANRVARLLLADARPEKILCLTFTKAAAAEMQHRLFKQLGEWAMLPDDVLTAKISEIGADARMILPKARRLFAKALETPGGLKVLTLHAFCQIGAHPLSHRGRSDAGLRGAGRRGGARPDGRGAAESAGARGPGRRETGRCGRLSGHRERRSPPQRHSWRAALGNDRRKMDRFFEGLDGGDFEDAVWRAHGVAPRLGWGEGILRRLARRDRTPRNSCATGWQRGKATDTKSGRLSDANSFR